MSKSAWLFRWSHLLVWSFELFYRSILCAHSEFSFHSIAPIWTIEQMKFCFDLWLGAFFLRIVPFRHHTASRASDSNVLFFMNQSFSMIPCFSFLFFLFLRACDWNIRFSKRFQTAERMKHSLWKPRLRVFKTPLTRLYAASFCQLTEIVELISPREKDRNETAEVDRQILQGHSKQVVLTVGKK